MAKSASTVRHHCTDCRQYDVIGRRCRPGHEDIPMPELPEVRGTSNNSCKAFVPARTSSKALNEERPRPMQIAAPATFHLSDVKHNCRSDTRAFNAEDIIGSRWFFFTERRGRFFSSPDRKSVV